MKKPWVIPCVLLAALLLAWFFRWDYTASKTLDTAVLKWKTDRWTGQKWLEVHAIGIQPSKNPSWEEWMSHVNREAAKVDQSRRAVQQPTTTPSLEVYGLINNELTSKDLPVKPYKSENPGTVRASATKIWRIAVVVSGFWLVYLIWVNPWIKRRRQARC